MATPDGGGARTWPHALLILAAVALAHGASLHGGAFLDDVYRVEQNRELDDVGRPWRHFVDPMTSTSYANIVQYRPMMPLTLSWTAWLGDRTGLARRAAHRIGSILLLAGCGVLLHLLLRELLARDGALPPGAANAALLGALAFALHPVAGVPVHYLCGRDLLLAVLFLLWTLLAYVRGGWVLPLVLFSLSLLSKQNAVLLPLVLLVLEVVVRPRPRRDWRTLARPLSFALPVVLFFAWTNLGLDFNDLDSLENDNPRSEFVATQASAHLFHYGRNLVWPDRLRLLPLYELRGWWSPDVLAGAAFVLAVLGAAALAWRRAPLVTLSVAGYALLFAPTSSLRPMRQTVTDYRQVPSLVFAAVLVAALASPLLARRAGVAVGSLLVALLGVATWRSAADWVDDEAAWGKAVRHGTTGIGHVNYARAIASQDPKGAETHYRVALEGNPGNVFARINLGLLLIGEGRADEGVAEVERAALPLPETLQWAFARRWLGEAYRKVGRHDEALAQYRLAADLDPGDVDAQYHTALYLQQLADPVETLPYLERIEDTEPGYRTSSFLHGYALQVAGRFGEAEPYYRRHLVKDPDHYQCHLNLGFGLREAGRPREAVDHFEAALRADPSQVGIHRELARCHRDLGDEETARAHDALAEGAGG